MTLQNSEKIQIVQDIKKAILRLMYNRHVRKCFCKTVSRGLFVPVITLVLTQWQ